MPTPAPRLDQVVPSATLAAGERARTLAAEGRDVIDLSQSSPWHPTPPHIVEAGVRALQEGNTNISAPRGIPEFRAALAEKARRDNGLPADPDHNILVTAGSKQGLYETVQAFVAPGDEVLLIEPIWVSFRHMVNLAGGVPVAVSLSAEEEWTLTYGSMASMVTPRTRALIINNPNNPTGRVYTRAELEAVARVAGEHDLLVISDETYEKFVFDGRKHVSIAALPGMWERTVTSFTFTKAYSMAGWRLGAMVGPEHAIAAATRLHEHAAGYGSPFVQLAGVAALTGPQDHLRRWHTDADDLRTRVAARLNRVRGVRCPVPQGATFLFPLVDAAMTSVEVVERLVEAAGVVATPGSGFGVSGEGHVRLALLRSPAPRVLEAADRMARALEEIVG